MKGLPFDLGLSDDDFRAMRAARALPPALDRDAAFRFIRDASAQVDAAVRRRPLLTGEPFTLPGIEQDPSSPTDPAA